MIDLDVFIVETCSQQVGSMVVGLIPTTEKLSSKVGKATLVAGWVVKFWMVLPMSIKS